MNILFYIPTDDESLEDRLILWEKGGFRGDILYGITHFPKYGINTIFHKFRKTKTKKLRIVSLVRAFDILFDKRSFEIVYAPYQYGLNLLIYLRSFGFYKKKIIVWQHISIPKPNNIIRRILKRQYYKGIDKMLFFSTTHYNESIQTGLIPVSRAHIIPWGPDLGFCDTLLKETEDEQNDFFLHTGVYMRDLDTLISSFAGLNKKLLLYVTDKKLQEKYANCPVNVSIKILQKSPESPYITGKEIAKAEVSLISSLKTPKLTGITALNEAIGLGKPVIMTKNKYIDIDIEKEKIGISVEVGDIDGWKRAINFFSENPEKIIEYGKNARALAEKKYNLDIFSKQVSDIIKSVLE